MLTAGTAHIELRHIVQPQTSQTAVLCAEMSAAAAAVDVDDPTPCQIRKTSSSLPVRKFVGVWPTTQTVSG